MFFRAKKWLWTKFTEGRGPDKAYAKYLRTLIVCKRIRMVHCRKS